MNDTVTTGRLAAEFMSLTVGERRDVVLFTEGRSSPGQNEIVDSFMSAAEKMALTVREVIETGNREDTAYDRMVSILSGSRIPAASTAQAQTRYRYAVPSPKAGTRERAYSSRRTSSRRSTITSRRASSPELSIRTRCIRRERLLRRCFFSSRKDGSQTNSYALRRSLS